MSYTNVRVESANDALVETLLKSQTLNSAGFGVGSEIKTNLPDAPIKREMIMNLQAL